jgi:hypothetical protein
MAYDQNFFLGRAAEGKDEWNKWRQANKGVRVTFARIDFSQAPRDEIDFSGFEFGDHADFSGCKWRGGEWQEIEEPEAFVPGRASFVGAAFGHEAKFTGAEFGDQANFTRATFRHGANFTGADFGYAASFPGVHFGHRASFDRVNFGDRAKFTGATFADAANFTSAIFGDKASFDGATFGDQAVFTGTTFGRDASFNASTFGNSAAFICAVFGDDAKFKGKTTFGHGIDFTGATFGSGATFDDAFFKGSVEFTGQSEEQWTKRLKAKLDPWDEKAFEAFKQRYEQSRTHDESGSDRFLTVSFARARFDGEAVFKGRSFEWEAIFTNARFYDPPGFDAVTNASRIDFTGAHIGFARPGRLHWTSKTEVPVSLRALRKLAEETKNHDLERDLYIEERKAERGVYLVQRFKDWVKDPKRKWALIAHIFWIAVMGVYWALADYGRSFVRPFAWLIASGFAFYYWGYLTVLAPLMPKTCPLGDKYDHVVRMLALGNAVPFVGPLTIDANVKEFLFCPNKAASCLPPIPPEGYQLLVVGQNLFSITCVFFIGLALRNYFRIK